MEYFSRAHNVPSRWKVVRCTTKLYNKPIYIALDIVAPCTIPLSRRRQNTEHTQTEDWDKQQSQQQQQQTTECLQSAE